MERNDDNGLWASDDGVTWILVEPSEIFISNRATDPETILPILPEVIAAQAIYDEISSRMNEALTIDQLKLAITEGLDAALTQLKGDI